MKNNIISDIILLIPFFIAMILQLITISIVWLILGIGSSILYVKDRIISN